MRKALCVGIDYYGGDADLPGCVNDANAIGQALSHNYDTSHNFEVTYLLAKDEASSCTSSKLFSAVKDLFSQDAETVVFYYSGHGGTVGRDGYLIPSDAENVDDYLSMETLLNLIHTSKAKNKVIILDSCYSGSLGKFSFLPGCDVLPQNTTILAASRANQLSNMTCYGSEFTLLLYEALYGGAANILGEITPASIYAFIDRSMRNPRQRPVFKANLENFVCLRKHIPSITLENLKKITTYFYKEHSEFPLDPSYESDKRDVEDKTHNLEHEEIFAILRKYHSLNLLVPVGEEYMYWAAVKSKSCILTPLGRYYWNLIKTERL